MHRPLPQTTAPLVAASVVLLGALAMTLAAAPEPARAQSQNDNCIVYTYVVPTGVHELSVVAIGQDGYPGRANEGSGGGAGGAGARVDYPDLAVVPGQTLYWGAIGGGEGYADWLFTDAAENSGSGGVAAYLSTDAPNGCDFGNNFILVAGGGGGGGDGDGSGPGGTGGDAGNQNSPQSVGNVPDGSGHAGNPGGDNQEYAGGGGLGGTLAAPGTGGAGGVTRSVICGCSYREEAGDNGWDILTAPPTSPLDSAGGGNGGLTFNDEGKGIAGGGGGGGLQPGGGGGGDGKLITGFGSTRLGAGAGGGGGGASFPGQFAVSHRWSQNSLNTWVVDIVPVYDTVTTLTSSANPSVTGQSITFTATVTTTAPTLGAASVTFTYLPTAAPVVVPLTITGQTGTATLTVPLTTGSSTVRATLPNGESRYLSATGQYVRDRTSTASLTQNVLASQSIFFTSSPGTRTAFGPTYTPTATSTSGLAVAFSVAPASSAVCSITAGVVSFIGGGTCTVNADQLGNGSYAPSPRTTQAISVATAASQVISFTSTPPTTLAAGETFTVAADGGLSGKPVVFTSGDPALCAVTGSTVTPLEGGDCRIFANQAAGGGYGAAPQAVQVVKISAMVRVVTISTTIPEHPSIGDGYGISATSDFRGEVDFRTGADSVGCVVAGATGQQYNGRDLVDNYNTIWFLGHGTCVIEAYSVDGLPGYLGDVQVQSTTVDGTPQQITFTSTAPTDPTYGGGTTVSATGGASGKPVTFRSTTPTICSISGAAVSFIGAGTCTVAADQAGTSVYLPADTVTTSFTVKRAVLTVAAPSSSAEYGAGMPAFDPEYSGFVASDTVDSLDAKSVCSLVLDASDLGAPNAGVHTVSCTGASDANYSVTATDGEFTVTPVDLRITASSGSVGYGFAPPAIVPEYLGLTGGDTAPAVAPDCSTDADETSAVGDYATTCVDAADANYDITTVDGVLSVTTATLTITPAPIAVGYGAAIPVVEPTYLGLAAGDTAPQVAPTCTTTLGDGDPVGPYASSCAGAADDNYVIGYSAGSVTVTPAALLVVAPAASVVYGSEVPTLAPAYEGLVAGDLAPTTPALCTTTATRTSSVGGYTVTCTVGADPNYAISPNTGEATATLTVTPAALTVTAPTLSVTVGTVPALSPIYAGLAAGDVAPHVGATCTSAVTASSAAGTYASKCTGVIDGNYDITYANGTITVTAIPVPPATSTPPVTPGPRGPVASNAPPVAAPTVRATPAPTASPTPKPTSEASESADPQAVASPDPDAPTALIVGGIIGGLLLLLLAAFGIRALRSRRD